MPPLLRFAMIAGVALVVSLRAAGMDADALVKQAMAAEARFDSRAALSAFLEADQATPNNAFILQKIARQYSDLVLDQPTTEGKKHYAQTALGYAERSV